MALQGQLILRLPLLVCGLLLMCAAAHAQSLKVDCATVGSSLDAFLKSKVFEGNKPTKLDALLLDNLRQRNSADNSKYIEPTLTGNEIVGCFGNRGRELLFLRNSVEDQRNRLRRDKAADEIRWQIGQITVIALGALATILLGLGSDKWKKLAIIPTALVTAVTAVIALEDYRGEIARDAKAESDLSKLDTEIDIKLLETATKGTRPPFVILGDQIEEWWVRADGIIKGVDDEWLSRFSREEKPEVRTVGRH